MTGQIIAHYTVLEKLGEGGMGVVYKARDTNLDRFVALKFLPPERVADAERRRRFFREARAASALNHPNIITIHEINQAGGADFIAMEYVSGRTLAEMITGKPLPPKDALHLALQAADALAAAHRAGIIHRDLKPGNIMVTAEGRLKILDFGLAKPAEAALPGNESTLTQVAGTAAYMPPEQAEGRPADARSDIYSLGAVLYEMLAGRKAFAGFTREEPPPLRDAPAGWQEVVSRCLRPNPGERFQSAAELKAALERTAGEPRSSPSIAVLPFANLSADKENEYFSDGLAEEIINALTKVPGLRVPARTSSFAYRGKEMDVGEIGARLKVGHVLEGSVRKAGERIRVTAQLINVADGYHLWSERYDRELSDVFAIQDEIAQAIVDKLCVRLVRQRPLIKTHTTSPEAYDLYLRGRYCMATTWLEGIPAAQSYFEKAIALDPSFAPAHAALAESYVYRDPGSLSAPKEAIRTAGSAAREALVLDDTIAEAHMVLGIAAALDYDWRGAEREFHRALELNTASPVCRYHYANELLIPRGRFDEAEAEIERELEQDPLSLRWQSHPGWLSYVRREYELAIRQNRRVVELNPNYAWPHFACALAESKLSRFDEAVKAMEGALEIGLTPIILGGLGMMLALAGRTSEARKLLEELIRQARVSYLCPAFEGWIHLGLGERDSAFERFEKAVEDHSFVMLFFGVDPLYDPIRTDPRYHALLKRMNLA